MQKNSAKYLNKGKKARLPVSVYLTYLLVVTLLFSGVTLSGYVSSASGSSSAGTAKFDVQAAADGWENGTSVALTHETVDSTNTKNYKFQVSNNSEVTITHSVRIKLGTALPASNLTITLDGTAFTPGNTEQTFAFGQLSAGASAEHTLTISSVGALDSVYTSAIQIFVDAEQVN